MAKRKARKKSERLIREIRLSYENLRQATERFYCGRFTKLTGLELNGDEQKALQESDRKIDEAWNDAEVVFSGMIGKQIMRELRRGEWK